MDRSIGRLGELGFGIMPMRIPFLGSPAWQTVFSDILLWEFRAAVESSIPRHRWVELGEEVRDELERGTKMTRERYEQALAVRRCFVSELGECLREVDAIVTPTTPVVAPRLTDEDPEIYAEARRFVTPVSLTGLPAISVPCGRTTSGLPAGVQLIASRDREETLLDIAEMFEAKEV